MSSRRYYEEDAGSRTGLRIPSVTRNSRGFEDPQQFFEASKRKMTERRGIDAQEEDEDDEEQYDDDGNGSRSAGSDDNHHGSERDTNDEYSNSLIEHHLDGSELGADSAEDSAVEDQISSGLQLNTAANKSRSSRRDGSVSRDLNANSGLSPGSLSRRSAGSARKVRDTTTREDGNEYADINRTTPRRNDRSSAGPSTPGTARRAAPSRLGSMSARDLNFDMSDGMDDQQLDYGGSKGDYSRDDDMPPIFDDDGPDSPGSGMQDGHASNDRNLTFSDSAISRRSRGARREDGDDEDAEPLKRSGRRTSGTRSSDASATRSSIGNASTTASTGRRAFNRVRHTGSMTPNRSIDLSQQSPSRSSISQRSPAKSVASPASSAADARALDFNDYDDNDAPLYEDDGEDRSDAPQVEVTIEEDVGEEALRGTSGEGHGLQSNSPQRGGLKKAPQKKGKARARSEESENEPIPGIQVDRRIIHRKNAPLSQQNQYEVVERIPDEYHLIGMGDPNETIEQDGPRRGKRLRYPPLEFWRGERAIFGRARLPAVPEGDEDDEEASHAGESDFEDKPRPQMVLPVPVLKGLVRIPRAPDEGTFSGLKLKKKTKKRGQGAVKSKDKKRKLVRSDSEDEDDDEGEAKILLDERGFTRQIEDGWDAETEQMGLVWDVDTGEETTRRIACKRSEVQTRKVFNSDFKFEKVFGIDSFMAAGIIEIPVGGSKPVKPSKTNSYVFIVSEGAVRVRVHRSNFVMGPGGMFLVPKGNTYSIENLAKRESRLFFAQARDPNLDPQQALGPAAGMIGSQSVSGPSGSQYAKASPSKRTRR